MHSLRLRAFYSNPLRRVRGLTPLRIDMGVDYGGSGRVFAVGRGRVVRADRNSTWPGGTYLAYRLLHGPAKGMVVYFAENVTLDSRIRVGRKIGRRRAFGTLKAPFPHSETGWARDDAPAYPPQAYGCYKEGELTHAGLNASEFFHKLGAPRGLTEGREPVCALPPHWPRWN